MTFDVDANGILNVKAQDKASGKEQSIRIEAASGLSDEEIQKMKDDAEKHADEDAKKKAMVDEKNTAEMLIFSAEKSLKEYGDKIDADLKKSVEEKIATAKTAKDGTDIEVMKKALEELSQEVSKIGEAMQKAGATSTETQTEPQSEEIKDAETEDKKEDTENK